MFYVFHRKQSLPYYGRDVTLLLAWRVFSSVHTCMFRKWCSYEPGIHCTRSSTKFRGVVARTLLYCSTRTVVHCSSIYFFVLYCTYTGIWKKICLGLWIYGKRWPPHISLSPLPGGIKCTNQPRNPKLSYKPQRFYPSSPLPFFIFLDPFSLVFAGGSFHIFLLAACHTRGRPPPKKKTISP